jgi:hypothetical protein
MTLEVDIATLGLTVEVADPTLAKDYVFPEDRMAVCTGLNPRGRATCHLLDGAFLARDIMQGAPRWLPWPLFLTLFIGAALLAAAISLISSVCQRLRYRGTSCRFRE